MHLDDLAPDTIRFRLDANECRILLRRRPAEDVIALGWHLDDDATFDETINRLKFKIRFLRVNERHHSVAIASVNALLSTRFARESSMSMSKWPRSTTWSSPISG
jgi:hypothetical protein